MTCCLYGCEPLYPWSYRWKTKGCSDYVVRTSVTTVSRKPLKEVVAQWRHGPVFMEEKCHLWCWIETPALSRTRNNLDNHCLPQARRVYGNIFRLQGDIARAHRAGAVRGRLDADAMACLLPRYEHAWDALGRDLNEWDSIPQSLQVLAQHQLWLVCHPLNNFWRHLWLFFKIQSEGIIWNNLLGIIVTYSASSKLKGYTWVNTSNTNILIRHWECNLPNNNKAVSIHSLVYILSLSLSLSLSLDCIYLLQDFLKKTPLKILSTSFNQWLCH